MLTIRSTTLPDAFHLACDPALETQGRWLAEVVAGFAGQGVGLRAGVNIEVGWSLLRLVAQADGGLRLCEPDFAGDPFNGLRDDVSTTLRMLAVQNAFARRYGAEAARIRFDDKVIARKGALAQERLWTLRSPPTRGDSGWYIGPLARLPAPQPHELESLFAFQLMSLRPQLLQALTLPADWAVVWDGSEVVEVLDEQGRAVAAR